MSDYLKKPSMRQGVSIVKGDKYPEGHTRDMHVTKPLNSNVEVPAKSDDLWRVEVPDDKIVADRDKKRGQAIKSVPKKPSGFDGGQKSQPRVKRVGWDISARVLKRSRPAAGAPVIDLDSSESIPTPTPIRSVFPTGQPFGGEEGATVMLKVIYAFSFSFLSFLSLLLISM